MQPLQTVVLNKIQPGVIPIFIIAPNKSDGDELAVLLSENVLSNKSGRFVSNSSSYKKNYFSNSDTRRLLPIKADEKKIEDYQAIVKLIIDEGFGNKKLWGLQLDYELFFELDIQSLFPYASFIFLYGNKVNKIGLQKSTEDYLESILAFHSKYGSNSVILDKNNVRYSPSIVLKSLVFSSDTVLKEINPANEITPRKEQQDTETISNNYTLYGLIQELDKRNSISNSSIWFNGNDVSIILLYDEYSGEEILLNKLNQFYHSFVPHPEFIIVCINENDSAKVNSALLNASIPVTNIKVAYDSKLSIAQSINNIANKSTSKYIIIDNLILSYSIINVMLPFKNFNPPSFVFGNLNTHKLNDNTESKLSIIELLTVKAIPENLIFLRENWAQLNGFDETLDLKFSVWDFCIRLLKKSDSYAFERDAVTPSGATKLKEESNILSEKGYAAIIKKHKTTFEEHLNNVLLQVTENQHLPQHEIVKLNYKISTLQSLITHSKDELRSVSDQRVLLQNHIQLLESRWYFKVANKISHFKKIFFKEAAPGGKGFLKMLKFFLFVFTKPGFRIFRKVIKSIFKKLYLITEDRPVKILYLDEGNENIDIAEYVDNYHDWITKKLKPSTLRKAYDETINTLTIKPKISIIMPVYNPPVEYLKAAIESVLEQQYDNLELCIADDCSTNEQVTRMLHTYSIRESRIKVVFRTENGHISACSNSALSLATGDYVLCLDHDDLLTPNCTFEIVKQINAQPDVEIIYSDEDKVDDNGTFSNPYLKPDFAPDNLFAKNYITHITVYKKQLLDKLGGYRIGFEGSQDYDLILRATDLTSKICHIPKILYHWRIHPLSASQQEDVKPYAFIAAKKALEETLVRRNLSGEVQYLPGLMGYRVKYDVSSFDKVSIIIPTKDQTKLMRNTIDSLIALTEYPNYEIIVLDNNSNTQEFFELMAEYKEKYGNIFRCIEAKIPFNFSKLMNIGVENSTGDYILLLNNDVEILHSDWLTTMVSYAQQKRIGAVGVKLLYPDDNIQHAGTVIGLGGVAGHVFVHYYKNDPGYFYYLQSVTNYSAVTAACLMIRRSVYDEVGGMDENLEVEYNDVDFCLKIMDAGYNNVYVPDVVLYHYESATRGHPHQNKVSYERHLREVKYFKDKWDKYIKRDPFYHPNLTLDRQDFSMNFNS
jgi:GT2 family glycosyltransferase